MTSPQIKIDFLTILLSVGCLTVGMLIGSYLGQSSLAEAKLQELQETHFWAHDNEDGTTFHDRRIKYAKNSEWAGENLYKGPCDIRNAMKLFEESPTHKAVLDHDYDTVEVQMEPIEGDEDWCYGVFIFTSN